MYRWRVGKAITFTRKQIHINKVTNAAAQAAGTNGPSAEADAGGPSNYDTCRVGVIEQCRGAASCAAAAADASGGGGGGGGRLEGRQGDVPPDGDAAAKGPLPPMTGCMERRRAAGDNGRGPWAAEWPPSTASAICWK